MNKRKHNGISSLYYYTTVETMRFILQDANIYATNLLYMNDSEEYINGIKEMKNLLNKKALNDLVLDEAAVAKELNRPVELYSISFSTQRDLLSQWSMYARESGVSLKMNFQEAHNYKLYRKSEKEQRNILGQNVFPRKVYYLTEDVMRKNNKGREYELTQKAIWKELTEIMGAITLEDLEANRLHVLYAMVPYIKRYEFQAEDEYRLAFDALEFDDEVRVDYRTDKHVLKPYLDVQCEGGWPVEEIIVGPGFNQKVVYNSLKHYLNHAELQLPYMNGTNFQKQCHTYFFGDGSCREKLEPIWNVKKDGLKQEDEGKRYKNFEALHKEIMDSEKLDEQYKNFLQRRFLSKKGVLLSRSEIPYIY